MEMGDLEARVANTGTLSRRQFLKGAAAMGAYAMLPRPADAAGLFNTNGISVERAISSRQNFQTEREKLIELLERYLKAPYPSERKAQALTELGQEPYGITNRHTSRITEANEKLMPWGLFMTQWFGNGTLINVFDLQSADVYRAVAHGKPMGDYHRVILGNKLFYIGDKMPQPAGHYRIAGKQVIFIPYHGWAKTGASRVPLEKLFDKTTMHEIGHLKLGFEGNAKGEEGAELFGISSSFDNKSRIESEEDIVKMLDMETEPTRYMEYVIQKVYSKWGISGKAFRNAGEAFKNVQGRLTESAKKINAMNPKYSVNPEKWSDTQFVAMGFLEFMRFLEQHPKYKINYYNLIGNGVTGNRASK